MKISFEVKHQSGVQKSFWRDLCLVSPATILCTALLMQASTSSTTPARTTVQAQPPNMPCGARLLREHLIAPGKGWLVIGRHASRSVGTERCAAQLLYWTGNNGRTWLDITPPQMTTNTIGEVFFLDSSHGWMLSSDALSEESNAQFYLFSTANGGKSWRELLLTRPMFNMYDDYTFPIQLFFSDSSHGWMMWHWGVMNSSINYLLATIDGGRTWNRLREPPGPGPLQFVSPRVGWMIGGLVTPDGIPDPEDENLWATRDGGGHWQVVSVPLPNSEEEETAFGSFRFKDSREGVAIAGLQPSGNLSQTFACITRDGGRSWKVSPVHLDASHAAPSIVGDQVIWSVSDWPEMKTRVQVGDRLITPVLPSEPSVRARMGDIDFVDERNGWAIASQLLTTTNGGRTFRVITPPRIADKLL